MTPTLVAAASLLAVLVVNRLNLARYIQGFVGAIFIRRTLRLAPYALPVGSGLLPAAGDLTAIAIGAMLGMVILAPHWRTLRSQLDPAFISMLPRLTLGRALTEVYSLAGVAIGQEYLYRWVLLRVVPGSVDVGPIVISTIIFVLVHPLQADGTYSAMDLMTIGLVGLCAALLVAWSGGIAGAAALHTAYNAPGMFQALARVRTRTGS